jgi:hypothetical protein
MQPSQADLSQLQNMMDSHDDNTITTNSRHQPAGAFGSLAAIHRDTLEWPAGGRKDVHHLGSKL